MLFYDKSELDDAFKKRRAKLLYEHEYNQRGSYSAYFSYRDVTKGDSSEAVIKIIHHRGNVKDLIKYVDDDKKTGSDDLTFSASGNILKKEELKEFEKFWQKRNRSDTKPNARHSTHIVLSTKEKPSRANIRKFKDVVARVASNQFVNKGYSCFFVVHTDKPHLHAHLVVHNKNLFTDKKIHFSKFSELYSIRKDFADGLTQKGWNYSSTLRKDSMMSLDGINEQKKHQNYVLNEVEKELGPDARAWTKKQFILKFSKDEKKAKQAKINLAKVRNLSKPQTRSDVLEQVEAYMAQKHKWDVKQTLHTKYPSIDKKAINSYIDSLFASQNRLAKAYNTKNKKSVEKYEAVTKLVDNITIIDISKDITDYQKTLQLRKQRAKEVEGFNLYGDIGKLYLRQLYKNLDQSRTDKQKNIVTSKIKDLKGGSVDKSEFDFFKQSTLEQNSKPYGVFFKQRVFSIEKHIAEKSGSKLEDITEVPRLFTLYAARRGSDAVFAYNSFKNGIDLYVDVLKSGDGEKIWKFSQVLSEKLGTSPEQKDMMNKKQKFNDHFDLSI